MSEAKINMLACKAQQQGVLSVDDAMYLAEQARTATRKCVSMAKNGDAVECFKKLVKRGYYHKAIADYRTVLQDVIVPLLDSLDLGVLPEIDPENAPYPILEQFMGVLIVERALETFETEPNENEGTDVD